LEHIGVYGSPKSEYFLLLILDWVATIRVFGCGLKIALADTKFSGFYGGGE
jgi:hypothetical protein